MEKGGNLISNYDEKLLEPGQDEVVAVVQVSEDDDEVSFKRIVSKSQILARKASMVVVAKPSVTHEKEQQAQLSTFAPYLLSIAIGIHSVLQSSALAD